MARHFSIEVLNNFAILLVLKAHKRTIRDIALTIAHLMNRLFESGEEDVILMSDLQHSSFKSRVLDWLAALIDDQAEGRIALPYSLESAVHQWIEHATFYPRPMTDPGQRIRIGRWWCDECRKHELRRLRRTPEHVQNVISSLPAVSRQDLGEDVHCNICLEPYYKTTAAEKDREGLSSDRSTSNSSYLEVSTAASSNKDFDQNERPLQLPCGHHFGKECLSTLYAPQAKEDMEHNRCPLCRAYIDDLRRKVYASDDVTWMW